MKLSEQTQKDLTAAMDEFERIDVSTRHFWGTTTALKNHIDERMETFKRSMFNFSGNPLHLGNSLGLPLGDVRVQTELANSKTLIDHLTSSAEYAEADAIVRPAVQKIEALQAKLRDEQNEEAAIEAARLEKLEVAKAAAVAAVEAEFLQAQPEAPSAPEPIKPFRGRVSKPEPEPAIA